MQKFCKLCISIRTTDKIIKCLNDCNWTIVFYIINSKNFINIIYMVRHGKISRYITESRFQGDRLKREQFFNEDYQNYKCITITHNYI